VEGSAVQVDADGPGKGCKTEGGEHGSDDGGFFRVVTCVADRVLQEVDARREKYNEKEKAQILFFSHTNSLSPQVVVPVQYRRQLLL
jgi:hypothetical protein